MKLAWLTDIHLNFIDNDARLKFYHKIINTKCNAVLISGDIAEAPSLRGILNEMADYIKKPLYFILGNHDYYRGQINDVRDAITTLTEKHDQLFWLPASGIQKLNNHTILLGQDGWADGRLGDYQNSKIALNDSRMITDLFQEKILGKFQLLEKMQKLADADAKQLQDNLIQAINQKPGKVIILIHIPPFKEACLHKGKISEEDWLPYFTSKVIGDVLISFAQKNLLTQFLVLCGHTHSEANYQPLSNLQVKVGKAEYSQPRIQELIEI